ncbi:MAG TPA: HAMP domain-containing sensor histidine kinase [Alphaproteobacteria bacterium]
MLQQTASRSVFTRRFDELVEPTLNPHDRVLLLARMGRWQWRVGTANIMFTPSLYLLLDLDPNNFVPSIKNLRMLVSSRDLGRMLVMINKVILDAQPGIADIHVLHPDKDHTGFHVRCYCTPEVDEDGQVIALEGLVQDVTTEKHDRTALRYAIDETEAANRAKSRFLAMMSHELRTPLNAIIGFSEVMQTELLGPLGNPRYATYVGDINQSGRFLLELINDVLDMSKIEAGKYELVIEPVNVLKVLRHACHMMETTAQDRQVALALRGAKGDDMVQADRRALLQILLNVLSNAIKFTPPGGHVVLQAEMDRPQKQLVISIADTGVGIPADKLDRVGEPFEQFGDAETTKQGGTGLGLAITKKLIQLHGGQFDIASQPGTGTTVTITLPL